MPLLELQGVCYTYPGSQPVEALRDISFDVERNEFVSVIGPSGCGKSTLLRLISDLLPVTGGRVLIGGEGSRVARRRREIGFVFQEPALMPWRSTAKNVRLPLEVLKRDRAGGRQTAESLLNLVGLGEFAGKRPDQLSGGMRQRVSIARALTYDPPLLLMDEPFGALDQITRDEMNNELLNVWEQKQSTVVFVTHSIGEAIYLSDRIVVLSPRPGRITDIVEVALPRPRDPAIKRSRQFFEIETQLLGALEGRSVHG
ncbi:MAG TPA: ABC transporter ATP-binding protein [Chloroflexota bacterium]|nr:ABC transporter ATP-binding protein [Chloroflexota bacterium]